MQTRSSWQDRDDRRHHMVIAPDVMHALRAIASNNCTWFLARQSGHGAQEMDHEFARAEGDADDRRRRGAALRQVTACFPSASSRSSAFARGDAVIVRGPDGHEIGRGLVAYDAEDAEKSAAVVSRCAAHSRHRGPREMVHRDDLVLGHA
jgi:glutamate 5-kinase